jgi:hypothetical protein
MDPVVAVRTMLLREALGDVVLRPGASVVARVASRAPERAVLVLAGVPLQARVPDDVPAGATLRLRVREVTPERVTLQLDGPPLMPGAAPPPAAPRGEAARVAVQDPPRRRTGAEGEEVASVALTFTGPSLGRLDLRIDLSAARVEATVDAAAGAAHDRAAEAAGRLRDALAARTGRPAAVHVRPRHDPVDVYA